ncbi:hypothetical protein [Streptomyces abyssomicinicus]|uniref:hypothetical protein n=1 Tax=Streptomyces abyssomicinicus TaxID=574929 RepID=UPI001250B8EE|nr:hypothetical protein [Streptomyces abyssomicinicus]
MWRHEFQPGRFISGLVLITAGVLYAGDATGEWHMPWLVAVPLVVGGLAIAAVAGLVAHTVRSGRRDGDDAVG